MRALFYLEDKLVAEEFYTCQQWKGENGNYLVIDTERGQRLFFDFSKNTNPNIGTVEDNIMKASRGRVDLRRFKALTLEDILKVENSYNISYLN